MRALHNPRQSQAPINITFEQKVLKLGAGETLLFEDNEGDFLIERYPWVKTVASKDVKKRPDLKPSKKISPNMPDENETVMQNIQKEVSGDDFYGAGVEEDNV